MIRYSPGRPKFLCSIIRKLCRVCTFLPSQAHIDFSFHNKTYFPNTISVSEDQPIVLIELNQQYSSHIAYSYLANQLAARSGAQIIAYVVQPSGLRAKVASYIKELLGLAEYGIYSSFGVQRFIRVAANSDQKDRAMKLYRQYAVKITSKREVESLHVNGVWIGDLVYDSYLRLNGLPTLDLGSKRFRAFLLNALEQFVFWSDLLHNNPVAAINVSHCVYLPAIPLRIGVKLDVDVFQTTLTHIFRLSKDNLFAYNDFFYFRSQFMELSEQERHLGLLEAERRLQRRFGGEVGVDMKYSKKSAYGASRHSRLLRPTEKTKILVAAHCFFDSPHSYGNNLFPDFYEWLEFLGRIANRTDYDWYIKTHPDYLPKTKKVIEAFIQRNPRFSLLPSDASHLQIIDEGIDVALTTYGTIGFEYAALR